MSPEAGLTRAGAVIGRERELDALDGAIDVAATGGTACVLLVGEGGIGKTRLLGETASRAETRRVAVLAGRAPITTPAAFSVVSSALRSWLRSHTAPESMGPFDRGLALIVPEWPTDAAPGDMDASQLRLLALEATVHFLRAVIAVAGTAVFIADDLHAADAESLETIRYVVSAAIAGLAVVAALRPNESADADAFVQQLRRDGRAEVIDVAPLDERAVGELVGAVLEANPPSPLVADVLARTDGVPLFVEELVRGHVQAGTVRFADGGATWRGGAADVPGTIRDLVDTRMELLDERERDVVAAGAVVGDFDPEVMRAVSQRDDAEVAAALGAGVRAGLLEVTGGSIAFRHAIIREAVLDTVVPHLVDTMHRRAAAALDTVAHDADAFERRATHLRAVGADDEAADALIAAADRWLRDHALLAAERAARLAREAARAASIRAAAADALARSLAAQGRWSEALELDAANVAEHGDTPERRLRRIACALEAGRPEDAEAVLAVASDLGDDAPELTLLAGRAALVRGDAARALDCARAVREAVDAGVDAHLAALDLEGRAFDFQGDRDAARQSWTRQACDAAAAGRTQAQLQAVVQLGKVELFAGDPPQRLREAVELAERAGSLVELAWAQENLAIALGHHGDVAAAAALLDDALARSRPLGIDQVAYLLGSKAMTRSFVVESVEDILGEAESLMPTPDLKFQTANMRGDIAMRAGRWNEAIEWFEQSAELARAMPGVVPLSSVCWLPWVLACAGRLDEAARAAADARNVADLARFYTRPVIVAAAEAAIAGDAEGVDAALAAAPRPMPMDTAEILVMAALVVGGDNRPLWLRQAYDIYDAAGATLDADRVRQALREAGGAVPRKRRQSAPVPADLAQAGVTARELDVLRLIAQGLPNAEIAEQLYVSVRTVEAHVSSMLSKLGARNRGELALKSRGLTDVD